MMVQASLAGVTLISETDAASKVRELRIFSAAQRERVGAAMSTVLSQWQSAWDWRGAHVETSSPQVRIFDAVDPAYAKAWSNKWMVCEFSGHGAGLPKLRWRAGDA